MIVAVVSPAVFVRAAIVAPVSTASLTRNFAAAGGTSQRVAVADRSILRRTVTVSLVRRITELTASRTRYYAATVAALIFGGLAALVSHNMVSAIGPFGLSVGLLGNAVVLQMKISDAKKQHSA